MRSSKRLTGFYRVGRSARVWLSLVGVLTFSLPASADPTPEELAVARDLFEAAQKAQTDKDWQACEQNVAEAIGIIETPGLRFHLAFCKEQQGRWVEALVDYKRARELVVGGVDAPDVEEMLGPAVARMESGLPKLVLQMHHIPEGTTLFLDGQERSTRLLGKAVPVDPGARRINVTAPGFLPFAQHINLLSQERRTLSIQLVPKFADWSGQAASGRAPARAAHNGNVSSPGSSLKPWVLVAEATLSLGGLVLGVIEVAELAQGTRNRDLLLVEIKPATCSATAAPPHPACGRLDDANENLNLLQTLSVVGFVSAGIGAAALVTTWIFWDDSVATTGANNAGARRAQQRPIQVGVVQVPGGALGGISGTF